MAETLLHALAFAPVFLLLVWLMCHIGARQAAPSPHMIGEYHADYSELSEKERTSGDAAMDDLLGRSRLVSRRVAIG